MDRQIERYIHTRYRYLGKGKGRSHTYCATSDKWSSFDPLDGRKVGVHGTLSKPSVHPTVMQESTVDSKKLEHACRMVNASFFSFFGFRMEAGHVQTFWLHCLWFRNYRFWHYLADAMR